MNREPARRERMPGLDLVRSVACVGIVLYHFSGGSNCEILKRLFHNYANGSWGNPLVALFLMLSGALLYLHYDEEFSLPEFYRRRFRAIYPEFWIAYACAYALMALKSRSLFYKGNPALLLLSATGLDGYLNYRIPNYYILGEWFLGAIILIYLLYPALRWAFRRVPLALTAILLIACVAADRAPFFRIAANRNLIVCLFEFELGMLMMKYRAALRRPVWTWLCLPLSLVLLLLPLPELPFSQLYTILHAFALYVLLERLGDRIAERGAKTCAPILRCAEISYPVYLTHNFIIRNVLDIRNPSGVPGAVIALLIVLILTFAAAGILHRISRRILRPKAQS